MHYEYDTTGDLSSLVVLTFLIVVLVPITYRVVRPRQLKNITTTKFPLQIDNDEKANQITKARINKKNVMAYFSFTYTFLAIGWAVVLYLGYKAANTKRESSFWNPYDILGISESATEKEIKKHYKKLSIKFHPDKVRLAINQTLEDVQQQFVGLTKAYKALTDEEVRKNFLDYGHPDGKQDLSVGIALPSWMVEGGQSLWVLGLYCLVLLVGLPVLVGRWWYRSASITKDGLLNVTAERFFRGIEDDLTTDQLITLLCKAAEFENSTLPEKELESVTAQIKDQAHIDIDTGASRDTEILLRAHLCRITLRDPSLVAAQQVVLDKVIMLHRGLLNTLLAYGYLATIIRAMELGPCLTQATSPGPSPLMQLPFISPEHSEQFRSQVGEVDLAGFVAMENGTRRKALGVSDDQYNQILKVAKALPDIEVLRVEFQVAGDKDVTPNAIVQLVFKIRRAGGRPLKESELQDEDDDEGDVDAILNAVQKAAETAEPDTLSWAPYFPSPPKNTFWLFMADIKQDRVIVGPITAEDIGETIRTFKLQFQAPPNAGLYTFQAHVKSDTYLGMDQNFNLQLNVVEESTLPTKDDDEISEPDEDTIAGQMAAMKGAPVKRINHEYDSSSEEELSDTDSDSDSD